MVDGDNQVRVVMKVWYTLMQKIVSDLCG